MLSSVVRLVDWIKSSPVTVCRPWNASASNVALLTLPWMVSAAMVHARVTAGASCASAASESTTTCSSAVPSQPVGAAVVGASVGPVLAGLAVGRVVGPVLTGLAVGGSVVGAPVGVPVGVSVGAAVVGATVVGASVGRLVIHSQVCPAVSQSGTHWCVRTHEHRWPAPLSTCSQIPNSVSSQLWLPSLQACRDGASDGPAVGARADGGAGVTRLDIVGTVVVGLGVVMAPDVGAEVTGAWHAASVVGAAVIGAWVTGLDVVGTAVVGLGVVGADCTGAEVAGASVTHCIWTTYAPLLLW